MAIEKYFIEQGDMATSEDLLDVVLSGAVQNEILVRNGSSQWVNQLLDTASLEDNAVSFGKQATLVQGRLIGRGGASGTGIPELLTIGSGLDLAGTVLSATGGGGSNALTEDINQTTHGFSVGDVLDHNGTIFILADRDDEATSDVQGIVSVNTDSNNFEITYAGRITTLTGLSIGTQYYLDSVAGGFTATEPAEGNIIAPIFYALTATTAIINVQRPIQVTDAGGAEVIDSLTSDSAASTSTSFIDVGLSFEMAANTRYIIEVWLPFTVPNVSDGIAFGLNGPASPNRVSGMWDGGGIDNDRVFDSYDDTVATTDQTSLKTSSFAKLSAIVDNGANAGTLNIRFHAEASASTVIKAGATMKARKVS